VKGADGQYVKEFTSHSGIVWGKEAEWLIRDGKKGSLVGCAGTFRVRKWEKDGKAGAGTDIQCQTAKILDREEVGDTETTQAPAPSRPAQGGASADTIEQPPFNICQFQGA
jgi:single-stranded DNA-binding protein